MPKNLHVINCVFLLGSIIGLYASVLHNKYGLLYLFTCFCFISIGLMFWMKNKTNENESWYVHGKEIRYNDLGKKIYEAEYRKKGIVFGDERVWSDDGTLISFRRYPKGKRHYPDSLVDLQFGKIFKQVSLFDSLNKGYQRIIQYGYFTMNSDSSKYDEQKTELSMVSTIDTLNFNYSTWGWARGRNKRYLYERNYTFDSNGVDYERRILFKEDGTIYNESTQKFDHKRNPFVDYLF